MSKYGSPSFAFLLAGGISLLGQKPKDFASEREAAQDDTTGLGDSWPEHTPTGMQRTMLSQGEAFYDQGTGLAHEALMASQATSRVVCYGFEGDTIGKAFMGHEGTFGVKYTVLAKNGELTKAKTDYLVSGQRDDGVILQSTATKTADWNSEGADSVDNSASTSAGGVGYQHVTAFSGFTGFVGKVRHSADDVTYADLVTFTNVTSAPNAQRSSVAGTVNRHLAFDGNVTGTGSITIWAGFARS